MSLGGFMADMGECSGNLFENGQIIKYIIHIYLYFETNMSSSFEKNVIYFKKYFRIIISAFLAIQFGVNTMAQPMVLSLGRDYHGRQGGVFSKPP